MVPGSSEVRQDARPLGDQRPDVGEGLRVGQQRGRPRWPPYASGCQAVTGRFSRPAISSMTARAWPATNHGEATCTCQAGRRSSAERSATARRTARSTPGPVAGHHHVHRARAQRPGAGRGTVEHQVRGDQGERRVLQARGLALAEVDHDAAASASGLTAASLRREREARPRRGRAATAAPWRRPVRRRTATPRSRGARGGRPGRDRPRRCAAVPGPVRHGRRVRRRPARR